MKRYGSGYEAADKLFAEAAAARKAMHDRLKELVAYLDHDPGEAASVTILDALELAQERAALEEIVDRASHRLAEMRQGYPACPRWPLHHRAKARA